MVQLDHRILLGGQDFDAVGQLSRAAAAAKTANANRDANALRAFNPVKEFLTGSGGNALRGGSSNGGGGLIGSMQQQQEEQMRQLALTGVELIKAGRLDEANAMIQQHVPGVPFITELDDPNLHAILAQVPGFAEAYQKRMELGQMVNPQAPPPSYELKDVNGDGVMEYVDPNNPNAPIVPVQGVQGGPAEAPEIKTVTLPDGREVSMQWDGEQWSPIGAPEGMPPPSPEIDVAGETALRKEFSGITEDYRALNNSVQAMAAAAQRGNGQGDIALVTNFMKMLDPGSVVREGEFRTAANSGGVISLIRSARARVESGDTLTPEMRQRFLDIAGDLMGIAENRYQSQVQVYEGIATDYGYDVGRSVPQYTGGPVEIPQIWTPEPPSPPPATVLDPNAVPASPPNAAPAAPPTPQPNTPDIAQFRMVIERAKDQLSDAELSQYNGLPTPQARLDFLRQRNLLQ